ncbi:hypothetical protein N7G274_004984 [Stereocaulon virgatum]|uniref:Uncharacterized protein n=1 Tax=Stereocaulon virgatum TaxID=373712 RepID=A0ABR4AAM7_9LECA
MIGYLGRMMLFENPYSDLGMALQSIAICMGPVLFLRTIYLMSEQYMDAFSSYGSFLRRERYKTIFCFIDLISAYLSTLGLLLASGTLDIPHQIWRGNRLARTGTIIQLFGLDSFACVVTLFFLHRYRYFRNRPARTDTPYQDFTRAFNKLPKTRRVMYSKVPVPGVSIAFLAIYVRCSYRFDRAMNPSDTRDQTSFIVYKSVMCLLAVVILTGLHPSYYFL